MLDERGEESGTGEGGYWGVKEMERERQRGNQSNGVVKWEKLIWAPLLLEVKSHSFYSSTMLTWSAWNSPGWNLRTNGNQLREEISGSLIKSWRSKTVYLKMKDDKVTTTPKTHFSKKTQIAELTNRFLGQFGMNSGNYRAVFCSRLWNN